MAELQAEVSGPLPLVLFLITDFIKIKIASRGDTMNITNDELKAIKGLKEFIDHPARYGCTINIGDAETYDERVGWIFEKADAAFAAVLARSLP